LRLLLDTHTVYWWHCGDLTLSASARASIAEDITIITADGAFNSYAVKLLW
jgi:PIN domain nuclease of toxin-antitoxin system